MSLPTQWLPKDLRGVVEMLIAAAVIAGSGIAVQAWVDSRAYAQVENHAGRERAAWEGIREDISEIKSDVKEIKKEMKVP